MASKQLDIPAYSKSTWVVSIDFAQTVADQR